MKKSTFFCTIMALIVTATPVASPAQIFKKLKDKAAAVINKQKPAAEKRTADAKTNDADDSTKPVDNTSKPAKDETSKETAAAPTGINAYGNYDFITGDRIIFEDVFTDEEMGEFPVQWKLISGQATVNMVAGKRAIAGNLDVFISPNVKNPVYLSDSFTIEFDWYTEKGGCPEIRFFSSDKTPKEDGQEICKIDFCSYDAWAYIGAKVTTEKQEIKSAYPEAIKSEKFYGKWHHMAIAYKTRRLKVYVDQYRVLSIPEFAVDPKSLALSTKYYYGGAFAFANMRIANGGGMKVLNKKFSDAKIVTHAINFDVDKATLKPESMGQLNLIAEILKSNADLKFEIQGHTDNSGQPAHNLSLSAERADAVKDQLVKMGIDETRLTTKGMGDTKPITANNTAEGRANNRRVEFIKL